MSAPCREKENVETRTSIGLNASSNLSSANSIEESDVLTKYGFEVSLTDTARVTFASPRPLETMQEIHEISELACVLHAAQ